jgi:hypothetical protein
LTLYRNLDLPDFACKRYPKRRRVSLQLGSLIHKSESGSLFDVNFYLRCISLVGLTAGFTLPGLAADVDWPREIDTPRGLVVIYQPQPDNLDNNTLEARAAVSVSLTGEPDAIYGAVWFKARLETNREDRTATIADVEVTQIRFPNEDDEMIAALKTLLENEIPRWDLPIAIDALVATIEHATERREAAANLSTAAPDILFVAAPAILVTLDGDARLQQQEGTSLMRVVNTPFTILLDTTTKTYYLNADATTWYQTTDLKGDWSIATAVPKEVAALAPPPDEAEPEPEAENAEGEPAEPGPAPRIVVATQPTELISSNGEPEFTPIDGTQLLYMSNTDSDVLLDLTSLFNYVLLSGRWFRADSMKGPWAYVRGEDLPDDFKMIPEDNDMGTVLYAVPGTELAREAALDAQIPQTASVDRKTATLNVEYDGEPDFKPIDGTPLTYAINTATPVIKYESAYFAVDDGVWFVAGSPQGKWQAATEVPDEIYDIPPESPMYFVTFVRVYSYTDDKVNVGYTSGYTGTYIYNTTVVYGTGYYYPGWYGTYYYPRPSTWGFHVRYNPWYGWSFGLSYSNGPFTFTIGRGGWYGHGWWGPGRYRGYRGGYRHGYRNGYRAGAWAGYRAGNRQSTRNNLYRSQNNKARGTEVRANQPDNRARSTAATNRNNDVFADRDGNVHRKTDQGWQERTNQGWQNSPDASRDNLGNAERNPASTQQQREPAADRNNSRDQSSNQNGSSREQLNRSHDSRQRGSQRTSNFNSSRGGGRGGGGRRR